MGSIRMLLVGILLLPDGGLALSSCPGLRQLPNGLLFFRYGGIYVTFFCNPGFKRYGYQTSSCVSGRWTRAPPVCVASGCPDVGSILHGSSTVHQGSSVVRYRCESGFKLFGSPMLYCNGSTWNGTKPMCKESEMMRSRQETFLEITKSHLLPNLNKPSSLKKLSENLFNVRHGNTGNTATKGYLVKYILSPEHRVDAITKTVPIVQHLPSNQPVNNRNAPENNAKREFQAKDNWDGKTASIASSDNFLNKGSSNDQYSQVKIQSESVSSSLLSTSAVSSPLYLPLPSLTGTTSPSSFWPSRSTLVTQPTPFSSTQSKSSISLLEAEPSSATKLPLSLPPSPSSAHSLSSKPTSTSLRQPSKSLLQSESSTVTNLSLPSSLPSMPSYPSPKPLLQQPLTLFHTTSVRTFPSTLISTQWTLKSSLFVKQNAPVSNTRTHTFTVAQRGLDSAPITSKPYGWLRGTKGRITEGEDIEAIRKEPQKKQILFNYDSKQLRTFPWITQIVTTDGASSKPASPLDEDVMSTLPFPSSESMRGVSSQDDTSNYTFTAMNEAKTAPSASDSIFLQFKEENPNLSTEISPSTSSIPTWSVTGIVSPKTSKDYGNLNLPSPKPWQRSITTTTIAMPQSPEAPHSQTSTAVNVGHPNTTKDATDAALPGPDSQSETKVNSNNEAYVQIKEELMSTDQILSLSNTFGQSQKINRPNNTQFTNSLRGAQRDFDQTKTISSGSTAAKGRTSSRNSAINRATIQARGNQIIQSESLSADKSNTATDILPDARGPTLTEPALQNNLREISVVDETEMAQVNLQRPVVCPSPPVPDHGILYFRNLVRPSPWQYKYYVQYSCTPGYTLVHGDQFSFCQHNGTWSGGRPVCADVNECTVGLNHCQQICINTFGSYKCGCQSGFLLAQDGKRCADIDECALSVGIASCLFGCINTPGSFQCHCPEGYQLSASNGHCRDIDECAENNGRGPCVMECQNAPGSFRCSCSYGYKLAGDGRSCITECPVGYRKENNTEQSNRHRHRHIQQCVDINECLDVYSRQRQCEWRCLNLPGSFRCICPRGYTLHDDRYHCEDINECNYKNGGCSQLCINNSGGYRCACPEGYIFSPYSRKNCQLIRV